jgi:hypothetical protein
LSEHSHDRASSSGTDVALRAQILSGVAHDLRQPLHALNLFAGALAIKADDPEISRLATSILNAVDALENQIQLILQDSPRTVRHEPGIETHASALPCAGALILVVDDDLAAREGTCALLTMRAVGVAARTSHRRPRSRHQYALRSGNHRSGVRLLFFGDSEHRGDGTADGVRHRGRRSDQCSCSRQARKAEQATDVGDL